MESAEDQSDEVTEHMWILDQENSGRAGQTQDHSIYFPFFPHFPSIFIYFDSTELEHSWISGSLGMDIDIISVSEHILTSVI